MIVVTHGGFLSLVHHACVGHYKGGLVRNCSIGEVHLSGGSRAVVRWNDTGHLSSASDEPMLFKPSEVL